MSGNRYKVLIKIKSEKWIDLNESRAWGMKVARIMQKEAKGLAGYESSKIILSYLKYDELKELNNGIK